jgi:hypothetical protein
MSIPAKNLPAYLTQNTVVKFKGTDFVITYVNAGSQTVGLRTQATGNVGVNCEISIMELINFVGNGSVTVIKSAGAA